MGGIPSLVILDADGKTITTDGREAVSEDPTGEDFPWKPVPAKDLLSAAKLAKADSTLSTADALKGKKRIAIYFSAHWCPPCRGFTPKLAERYKELVGKGEDFEVVFVSSDKDEAAFSEYYASMPWLALPFADREAKAKRSKKFKVSGIPALIILDEQGELINKEGRSCIMDAPETWTPPTLWDALTGDLLGEL